MEKRQQAINKTVEPVGLALKAWDEVEDLAKEVAEGRFRSDLYYRINVIGLHVPSLRERRRDIPLLANFLLQRLSGTEGGSVQKLSDPAMDALMGYSFPGNVRELENILERACTLCSGDTIGVEDLRLNQGIELEVTPEPASGMGPPPVEEAFGNLDDYLENIEREVLTRALEQSRWNKTAAAKLLGISFRSLRYRLKKLELDD